MIKVFKGKIDELLDETLFNACLKYVGERVSSKISKIKNQNSKLRTLGGWTLLKIALEELNIVYLYDDIIYNEYGKPYFANSKDYYFNISHSKDYFICAISYYEIGCDIEKIRNELPKIYTKVFHKDELEYIDYFLNQKNIENNLQIKNFTKLWSIKESFIKCIGNSIFEFYIKNNDISLIDIKKQDFTSEIVYLNKKIYVNSIFIENYYISVSSYNEVWDKNINYIQLKQKLLQK